MRAGKGAKAEDGRQRITLGREGLEGNWARSTGSKDTPSREEEITKDAEGQTLERSI